MNQQKERKEGRGTFIPVNQLHEHYRHDLHSAIARAIELLEDKGYTVTPPAEKNLLAA
jgi:hypothetical protein